MDKRDLKYRYSDSGRMTPEEWRRIWLDKFNRRLSAEPIAAANRAAYSAAMERFLSDHPAPRNVSAAELVEYAKRNGACALEALGFFYRWIAKSDEHADLLCRLRDGVGDSGVSLSKADRYPTAAGASQDRSALDGPAKDRTPPASEISPWIDRLEDELKLRRYSSRTVKNYASAVTQFLARYRGDPRAATVEDLRAVIREWTETRMHAPTTVNLRIGALAFFFTAIAKNPAAMEGISYQKKPKALPEIYSVQEVDRILQAPANLKHRLVLMIAYGCGLRLGELVRMRVGDLDFDRRLLWVRYGKGAKDRRIMLDPALQELLKAYVIGMKPTAYLFTGADGVDHLSPRSAQMILEHACHKAGVTRKGSMHTRSDTRLPPICLNRALTSGIYNPSWAMNRARPRRSILMSLPRR